jgi:hypothetical protein
MLLKKAIMNRSTAAPTHVRRDCFTSDSKVAERRGRFGRGTDMLLPSEIAYGPRSLVEVGLEKDIAAALLIEGIVVAGQPLRHSAVREPWQHRSDPCR